MCVDLLGQDKSSDLDMHLSRRLKVKDSLGIGQVGIWKTINK